MIELLLLIVGIVIVIKFSGTTSAMAKGAETKSQVWAEKIISDAVIDRQDNYDAFKDRLGDRKVISHKNFLEEMEVND